MTFIFLIAQIALIKSGIHYISQHPRNTNQNLNNMYIFLLLFLFIFIKNIEYRKKEEKGN